MAQAANGVTNSHYSARGNWRVLGVLVAEKEESEKLVGLMGNVVVRCLGRWRGERVHLYVLLAD